MSESVTLKSYFYEVLIPSSQKNTSSPIEDILHHVSISFMKKLALYKCFNPRTHTGCDWWYAVRVAHTKCFNPRTHTGCDYYLIQGDVSYAAKCFNPRTHTGCDIAKRRPIYTSYRFNPRTHTGCDLVYIIDNQQFKLFQSTHPHGVRQSVVSTI